MSSHLAHGRWLIPEYETTHFVTTRFGAGSSSHPVPAEPERDATADMQLALRADDFIAGYLAIRRPAIRTALGLHEYDGKVSDFSRIPSGGKWIVCGGLIANWPPFRWIR